MAAPSLSLDSPQVRTIITPIALASLPVGGPATLLAASPPQALSVRGSFTAYMAMSAGAAQVTPYAWVDSQWIPLGDSANTPKMLAADFVNAIGPVGMGRFISQSNQTLVWAFVKSGAGAISYFSVMGGGF